MLVPPVGLAVDWRHLTFAGFGLQKEEDEKSQVHWSLPRGEEQDVAASDDNHRWAGDDRNEEAITNVHFSSLQVTPRYGVASRDYSSWNTYVSNQLNE